MKYVGLIMFGCILSLSAIEFGLRLMGVKPATYLRKFSRYHEILGWEKTPGTEGFFQRGDIKIHERLNSKGLRSPDYDYEKPARTYRILFVGDSFTEGYDVEFENLFSTILETQLNRDSAVHKHVEVINAGTGGYSNDQEYLFYRLEGRKYFPDAVVMMMYASNDVYYNLLERYGNYYKPKFVAKEGELILSNTPLPKPPATEGIKDIFRNLSLYQFTLNNILTRFPRATQQLTGWGLVAPATAEIATAKGSAPASFGIFDRSPSKEINEAWDITKHILRAMQKLCDSNRTQFILFSIPDKFQVYETDWKDTQDRYHVNDSVWDRSGPEKVLNEFCHKEQILFVNGLDSLRAERTSLVSLYNGVHWNENGNQKVAALLNRVIRDRCLKEAN